MLMLYKALLNQRKKKHDKACLSSSSKFSVYFFSRRQNVIRPYVGPIVSQTEFKHLNAFARQKQNEGNSGELGLTLPWGGASRGPQGTTGVALGSGRPRSRETAFLGVSLYKRLRFVGPMGPVLIHSHSLIHSRDMSRAFSPSQPRTGCWGHSGLEDGRGP